MNPVAWQRQSQLQWWLIAATIASCKHHVRGLKNLRSQASYVFLPKHSHVSTRHVHVSQFYVSLIYGEHLANVYFGDIPHFTLHSAEKNPHWIFSKLPVDNFPHSAFRKLPLPTSTRIRSHLVSFCYNTKIVLCNLFLLILLNKLHRSVHNMRFI